MSRNNLVSAKIEWDFTWDEVFARVQSVFDENPSRASLEKALTAALLAAFDLGYHSATKGASCMGNA